MNEREVIQNAISFLGGKENLRSVYFVACGGSFAGFYPACYFLQHESEALKAEMYTSNEFVHATPKGCGKNSIVVLCSMRGTAETSVAAKCARERGAYVISVYVQESDMTRVSNVAVPYKSLADDSALIDEINPTIGLRMAVEILEQTEGFEYYSDMLTAFSSVNAVYTSAIEKMRPKAKEFAEAVKDDEVVYVMGGGPAMGASYIFSICNLMEMVQTHSPTVNTGELLHGPFETVDKDVAIFFILSEGRTRPVDERALKFLKTYGERLFILDVRDTGILELPASVREYFNHLILSSLLNNVYLRELAAAKNHDYLSRRYMWKVEY